MSVAEVRSRAASRGHGAEFAWPADFVRVPDEDWTRQPVDRFGLNYDDVGNHGWYKNLEPTIAQVLSALEPGEPARRLLQRDRDPDPGGYSRGSAIRSGILNVDASPKFLRVAVEAFQGDERGCFPAAPLAQGGKEVGEAGRGRRAGAARPRGRRQ